MQFTTCKYLFFFFKESYYVKKLYNSIFKNIDDYHVTLKN